jgi:glycopeptide antibiotics resistance protein
MRGILFAVLALYCAALLYGTLDPFNFNLKRMRTAGSSRNKIEWVPFTRVCPKRGAWCLPDKVRSVRDSGLNLAIFMPVGAMLAASWLWRGTSTRRVGFATAAGFALSLAIETAQ